MEDMAQVPFPGTGRGECSETTVEIKIKTLDSQTYTLRVDKFVPVPALKEQIANVTGVLSEQQRLICRGKVLKDDEQLSAYHVEDGHTLHLVVRQPFDASSSPAAAGVIGNDIGANVPGSNPPNTWNMGGQNVIFGALNLSSQEYAPSTDLSRIFSTAIGSLGGNNINIDGGNLEMGPREESLGSDDRVANMPSQVQVGQISAEGGFEQNQDALPTLNPAYPAVIPDSLTTLLQYINHLQHQFDVVGSNGGSQSAASVSQGNFAANQGLPTPAALAEVVLSARRLLVGPVVGCLSDLASQLQDQSTVNDERTRSDIQSYSLRSGELIQNLGSLLLELGRTIMTVRMGHTSDEAVVNAGPAMFISASSPNPIMVQAAIGLGGSGYPPAHVLAGGLGTRNIDIRIRRGNSVPVVPSGMAASGSEPSSGQQPLRRSDSSRRSVDNLLHRILQGVSSASPVSGESTVRVVPIRTVIAIPAGVSRPSSNSSGNLDTPHFPIFTRLQDRLPRIPNDVRGPTASTGDTPIVHDQHPFPDDNLHGANSELTSVNVLRERNPLPINSSNGASFTSSGSESAQHPEEIFLPPNSLAGRQDGNTGVREIHEQRTDAMTISDRIRLSNAKIEATNSSSSGPASVDNVSMNRSGQETSQEHDQDGSRRNSQEDDRDGILFSSMLRQIMPHILRDGVMQESNISPQSLILDGGSSSGEQAEGLCGTDEQVRRDPPINPAAKRQKRE